MAKLFISYRRADFGHHAPIVASHVRLWLKSLNHEVFVDLQDIEARGLEQLYEKIRESIAVIALIGPQWNEIRREKLDKKEEDWVVDKEIACAVKNDIDVITVVDQGSRYPQLDLIPETPHGLRGVFRQHHPKVDFARIGEGEFQRITGRIENIARRYSAVVGGTGGRFAAELGIRLLQVPGGQFMLGEDQLNSNQGAQRDSPAHRVEITYDYFLSETPVPVRAFQTFIKEKRWTPTTQSANDTGIHRRLRTWDAPGFRQTDDHPVVCVSWDDAVAFANWLNELTKWGFRLPTEAEWERACRSGASSESEEQLRMGAWAVRNSRQRGLGRTRAVSKGVPNPLGFRDMMGNVWEWCHDFYQPYQGNVQSAARINPQGTKPWRAGHRVLRGGSWSDPVESLRPTARIHLPASRTLPNVGFRVACRFQPEPVST